MTTPMRQQAALLGSLDPAPYMLGGGPVGCLLLHGWSGHPGELRPMAEFLAEKGLTVSVPQLAGHGSGPEALVSVSFRQWIASVNSAWLALRRDHPTSFVMGLSMGGALALDLAERRPGEMTGVVSMSAPTFLGRGLLSAILPVGRHVVKWYYPLGKVDLSDEATQTRVTRMLRGMEIDFNDPATVEQVRLETRLPVASVYQLQVLLRHVRRRLPAVRAPLLVMHGRLDEVVQPRCAEDIQARTGSRDKQLVWLDHSHHMVTLDVDHQEVWDRAWEFVRSHEPAAL